MARTEQLYEVSGQPVRVRTSLRHQPGSAVPFVLGALLAVGAVVVANQPAKSSEAGAAAAIVAPSDTPSPLVDPSLLSDPSPADSPTPDVTVAPSPDATIDATGAIATATPDATVAATADPTPTATPDPTPVPTATPDPTPYPSPAYAIACTLMGPLEVYCNGSGSDHAVTYAWDAAGQTGTAPDITLTFAQAGSYTVTLTVGNGLGDYSSGSDIVVVYGPTPEPTAQPS